MNKKSQVSVFILIGLVIILLVGLLLLFQNRKTGMSPGIDQAMLASKTIVESCLETKTLEAIERYPIKDENSDLQEQYIEKELPKCADFTAIKRQGFNVKTGNPESEMKPNDEVILSSIKFPITITAKDQGQTITSFSYLIKITSYLEISTGNVLRSSDRKAEIRLPTGAIVKKDGNLLSSIELKLRERNFDNRVNAVVVGSTVYDGQPDGATFDPYAEITIGYDENDIPVGDEEGSLTIAYYDEENSRWVGLESEVDAAANKIKARIRHFSPLAVTAGCGPSQKTSPQVTHTGWLYREPCYSGSREKISCTPKWIEGSDGALYAPQGVDVKIDSRYSLEEPKCYYGDWDKNPETQYTYGYKSASEAGGKGYFYMKFVQDGNNVCVYEKDPVKLDLKCDDECKVKFNGNPLEKGEDGKFAVKIEQIAETGKTNIVEVDVINKEAHCSGANGKIEFTGYGLLPTCREGEIVSNCICGSTNAIIDYDREKLLETMEKQKKTFTELTDSELKEAIPAQNRIYCCTGQISKTECGAKKEPANKPAAGQDCTVQERINHLCKYGRNNDENYNPIFPQCSGVSSGRPVGFSDPDISEELRLLSKRDRNIKLDEIHEYSEGGKYSSNRACGKATAKPEEPEKEEKTAQISEGPLACSTSATNDPDHYYYGLVPGPGMVEFSQNWITWVENAYAFGKSDTAGWHVDVKPPEHGGLILVRYVEDGYKSNPPELKDQWSSLREDWEWGDNLPIYIKQVSRFGTPNDMNTCWKKNDCMSYPSECVGCKGWKCEQTCSTPDKGMLTSEGVRKYEFLPSKLSVNFVLPDGSLSKNIILSGKESYRLRFTTEKNEPYFGFIQVYPNKVWTVDGYPVFIAGQDIVIKSSAWIGALDDKATVKFMMRPQASNQNIDVSKKLEKIDQPNIETIPWSDELTFSRDDSVKQARDMNQRGSVSGSLVATQNKANAPRQISGQSVLDSRYNMPSLIPGSYAVFEDKLNKDANGNPAKFRIEVEYGECACGGKALRMTKNSASTYWEPGRASSLRFCVKEFKGSKGTQLKSTCCPMYDHARSSFRPIGIISSVEYPDNPADAYLGKLGDLGGGEIPPIKSTLPEGKLVTDTKGQRLYLGTDSSGNEKWEYCDDSKVGKTYAVNRKTNYDLLCYKEPEGKMHYVTCNSNGIQENAEDATVKHVTEDTIMEAKGKDYICTGNQEKWLSCESENQKIEGKEMYCCNGRIYSVPCQTANLKKDKLCLHTELGYPQDYKQLELAREIGATYIKQSFPWSLGEPAPGKYDWGLFDLWFARANEKRLKIIPRISYAPSWAKTEKGVNTNFRRGDDTGFATRPDRARFADFGNYVREFTSRYKPDYVQIWNEPNLAEEWSSKGPNPAEYAELFKVAYIAVKTGNPDTKVIMGGLAPTSTIMFNAYCEKHNPDWDVCKNPSSDNMYLSMSEFDFVEKLYEADPLIENYFDVVGVNSHPYSETSPESLDFPDVKCDPSSRIISPYTGADVSYLVNGGCWGLDRVRLFRQTQIDRNRMKNKQVMLTEFSYYLNSYIKESGGSAVSLFDMNNPQEEKKEETRQAVRLFKGYRTATSEWNDWTGPVCWFIATDPFKQNNWEKEGNMLKQKPPFDRRVSTCAYAKNVAERPAISETCRALT